MIKMSIFGNIMYNVLSKIVWVFDVYVYIFNCNKTNYFIDNYFYMR